VSQVRVRVARDLRLGLGEVRSGVELPWTASDAGEVRSGVAMASDAGDLLSSCPLDPTG
jgi:hypothetical protein